MFGSIQKMPRLTEDLHVASREAIEADYHLFLAPYHGSQRASQYYPSLVDNENILANNGWMLGGSFEDESLDGTRYETVFVAVESTSGKMVIAAFADNVSPAKFFVGRTDRSFAAGLEFVPAT